MDASNIPDRSNGQTILASWFNTIKAYLIDYSIVPLNIDEDYTFTGQTNTVMVDASTQDVDITLPDAATNKGKTYSIIAKDVTNTITILPDSGTIVGESSYRLRMKYESIRLTSDGVDWYAL